MAQYTSELGKEFIKKHEGCVLRAYKDVAGIWTIGYGHTTAAGSLKVTPGLKITQEQADDLLTADLRKFETRVVTRMGGLRQEVLDGAVSFDFNTGAIRKASWVSKLLRGEFVKAEDSLKLWRKAGGKIAPGLVTRRAEEADLIFRHKYPSEIMAKRTRKKSKVDPIVLEGQELLTAKGFNPGAIDGVLGRKTKAAVLAYQKLHPDLENDGILGVATLNQLRREANMGKDIVKAATTKGGPLAAASSYLGSLAGLPWQWILPAVAVVVIAWFAWTHRDVLQTRWNNFFGKEVD